MNTNEIKISVRDAQKHVFPFINYGTILLWIKKGLLIPNTRHKTHQGPDPIVLLDKADLVTIAILHGLFRFGVGYKDIGGAPTPNRLIFKSVVMEIDASALMSGHVAIPPTITLESGRQMQEFLLNNDYDVIVCWGPEVEARESAIYVYPRSFKIEHELQIKSITDVTHCPFGTIFIYAKQWERYVDGRLKGLKLRK